jgi:protein-tyrosine-phosphatase
MADSTRVRVLFVCVGNACRSPMAEAIARHEAHDIIEPSSAGLYPLGRLADLTEQTLTANGYPLEGLSSKPLRSEALQNSDLLVNLSGVSLTPLFKGDSAVEPFASCGIAENIEEWEVADPYGTTPEIYQEILQQIQGRVRQLATRLRAVNRSAHA